LIEYIEATLISLFNHDGCIQAQFNDNSNKL